MVSVIMPAYNAERFIEESVRSVINQTYTDWELIVIDDQSTDNTYNIAEALAKKDPRIKLFRNDKNMGVALTRNKGFELCEGDYIALFDSDDVWLEDKLLKQMQLITSSDADITYCSYQIIDELGNKKYTDFIVPAKANFEDSLISSAISCSTVLLSREIIDKYRFKPNYYHEDLVLWLQLLKDGYRAYGVTDVLAKYRVCQGARSFNKFKSMKNRFMVYYSYLKLPLYKCCILFIKSTLCGLKKYSGNGK